MAYFEGLVVGEDGEPVSAVDIGGIPYYVIDDQGFHRHIEARAVDRVVLKQFLDELADHKEEAALAMLRLIGRDDLFSKAMVDSALQQIDVEEVLDRGLPPDARQWLGMMGLRVVINLHGEVIRVEMPSVPDGWEDQ